MFRKSKHKNNYPCITLFFVLVLILPSNTIAIPKLGVATEGVYYVGPYNSFDAYEDYFASGSAPSSENGGYKGFELGPSGSNLTIFTSLVDYDIYLLTNARKSSILFGGQALTPIPYETGWANGYRSTSYYALNIGKVNTSTWNLLPSDIFIHNRSPFYSYTASISYNGNIHSGSYFFAAADIEGDGLHFNTIEPDPFSHASASTTASPVPEPATMLLLGGGLTGLFALRKKLKKLD